MDYTEIQSDLNTVLAVVPDMGLLEYGEYLLVREVWRDPRTKYPGTAFLQIIPPTDKEQISAAMRAHLTAYYIERALGLNACKEIIDPRDSNGVVMKIVDHARIAELNDRARQNLENYFLTPQVRSLPQEQLQEVIEAVKNFTNFTHDFGSFKVGEEDYYFKIDYYNKAIECGSPDPTNVALTRRVITVMHWSEY